MFHQELHRLCSDSSNPFFEQKRFPAHAHEIQPFPDLCHMCVWEMCVQLTRRISAQHVLMSEFCDKMVVMVPQHSPPVGAAQCCFWKMRQSLGWKPVRSLSVVYWSLCESFFSLPLQWLLSALSPVFQAPSQLCSCSCCSDPAVLIRLLPHYLSLQPSSEQQIRVERAHPARESKTAISNTWCGDGILLQALLLQSGDFFGGKKNKTSKQNKKLDNTGYYFQKPLDCVWC